jgi:polyphosphate kinase
MVRCRENIKIKSIVGKFLEHSRIVITDLIPEDANDDVESSVLIGSSDLLNRNLYKRIEVLVKVESSASQAKVQKIFDALWNDTANSWTMDEKGVYSRVNSTKDWHHDAHKELMSLE